jgi:hypothetical protein
VIVPLTLTIDPAWGGDLATDYELVAWVQDAVTKEVVDAEKINLQSILDGVTENNTVQGGMKIYPNPVRNTLTIETLQSVGKSTLSIINVNGQELLKQQLVSTKTELDVSNFTTGVYTIRLLDNNSVEIKKFVKE